MRTTSTALLLTSCCLLSLASSRTDPITREDHDLAKSASAQCRSEATSRESLDACEACHEASSKLRLGPAYCLEGRGWFEYRAGHAHRARGLFENCLAFSSEVAGCHAGFAQLELAAGRPANARDHARRALKLDPHDAHAQVVAARVRALQRTAIPDSCPESSSIDVLAVIEELSAERPELRREKWFPAATPSISCTDPEPSLLMTLRLDESDGGGSVVAAFTRNASEVDLAWAFRTSGPGKPMIDAYLERGRALQVLRAVEASDEPARHQRRDVAVWTLPSLRTWDVPFTVGRGIADQNPLVVRWRRAPPSCGIERIYVAEKPLRIVERELVRCSADLASPELLQHEGYVSEGG